MNADPALFPSSSPPPAGLNSRQHELKKMDQGTGASEGEQEIQSML